ncbi:ethanolamine kinase 1-like [Chironomus tepperi]|uniref:ethanolamine kinase 1-like n=1 Tax=Chironomus tepperi TaxID=113505 RepID=UPI00391FA559
MNLELKLEIDEKNFEEGILNILKTIRSNWDERDINFKVFSEGITNKLIGTYCTSVSEMILFRINGNKTDILIDRIAEIKNMKLLNRYGFAPKIYATFLNGICYEFIPGVILNTNSVYEPSIWKTIATQMAKMHQIPLTNEQLNCEPMIKRVGLKYLEMIPEKFTNEAINARISRLFPSKSELSAHFSSLLDILCSTNSQIVFCHNDLLLSNILYTSDTSKISFIDFEYAEPNWQAFDIGNHFAKMSGASSDSSIDYSRFPDKDFQMKWLKYYLKGVS